MLIKAIGGLAVANALSQLLQLLAQPILAKMYTPAQFGVLAEVVSISTILAVIGTYQINNYLVIENDEVRLRHLIRLGGSLGLVSAAAALFFLWITSISSGVLDLSKSAIVSASVLVLVYCHANMIRGILTAKNLFKVLALYTLSRSVLILLSQSLLSNLSINNGLLLGMLTGEILAQIGLLAIKRTTDLFNIIFIDLFTNIISITRHKPVFFLVGTIQEFVSSAIFVLPMILVAQLYDHSSGGQMALAHRMAWAPFLLLAQSISPVLYRHYSSTATMSLANNYLLRGAPSLVVFVLGGLFVFLASEEAFKLLFDETWNEAEAMASWVSLWGMSFLTALPYRICYRTLSKQHLQLTIDAVVVVSMLMISYLHPLSAIDFVKYICIAGVAQNWALIIVMRIHFNRTCK